MDDTQSLLGTPREWAKDLTIATVIGVFLGVIGPFGSYNGGSLELRVFYWTGNMWIGFVIISTVVRLAMRAASRFDLPVWFTLAAGVAIGSLPLGFLMAVFSAWFWHGALSHISLFMVWYGQTLTISEPFAFFYFFVGRRGGFFGDPSPAPAPVPAVRIDETARPITEAGSGVASGSFLSRLPPRVGQDLLCLQMEDHYVRAHTRRGSDLILIPLKDAIAELGEVEGMQVHRSWWVARAAVAAPVANGRNLFLRLTNDMQVPVSRASVAKLKLAGWIEGY